MPTDLDPSWVHPSRRGLKRPKKRPLLGCFLFVLITAAALGLWWVIVVVTVYGYRFAVSLPT